MLTRSRARIREPSLTFCQVRQNGAKAGCIEPQTRRGWQAADERRSRAVCLEAAAFGTGLTRQPEYRGEAIRQ